MDVEENRPGGRSKKTAIKLVVIGIVVVCAGLTAGVVLAMQASSNLLPDSVKQKLSFSAYIPNELPGAYKINPSSYSLTEGVLVFAASDGASGNLAFTEQKVPAGFSFADFYDVQLVNRKTLSDTAYSAELGSSAVDPKTKILSIKAGNTWILLSTQAQLDDTAFQLIAKSLERQ